MCDLTQIPNQFWNREVKSFWDLKITEIRLKPCDLWSLEIMMAKIKRKGIYDHSWSWSEMFDDHDPISQLTQLVYFIYPPLFYKVP